MTENSKISFQEKQEPGFLERLLLSRRWDFASALLFFCAAISVGLALFHLFTAVYGTPEGRSFRSVHLSVMLTLAIFMKPLFRSSMYDPVWVDGDARNNLRALGLGIDLALVGLILFVQLWTIWDINAFHMRYGEKTPNDLIVGGILIALVFEATRRVVGWAMVLITGFFMFHALNAQYFFGFFYGPPVRWGKFVDTLFMSSDGIFGIPLFVCATYIVLFIIFGAVLIRSGAGKFFIELAVSLTGHRIGGPAKAAAVASGFMGTVSGSAVANVVTTGSFTIPLMKRVGYRAKFAAAVEACASSGGQITPPIMGAAAFIMAEFLAVPLHDDHHCRDYPCFPLLHHHLLHGAPGGGKARSSRPAESRVTANGRGPAPWLASALRARRPDQLPPVWLHAHAGSLLRAGGACRSQLHQPFYADEPS